MIKGAFHTDGSGLWGCPEMVINVTNARVRDFGEMWGEGDDFGELRVYFDNIVPGLIYTDQGFLDEIRVALCALALKGKDVCYSEQGMQGPDWVSFDVGPEFIKSWREKNA